MEQKNIKRLEILEQESENRKKREQKNIKRFEILEQESENRKKREKEYENRKKRQENLINKNPFRGLFKPEIDKTRQALLKSIQSNSTKETNMVSSRWNIIKSRLGWLFNGSMTRKYLKNLLASTNTYEEAAVQMLNNIQNSDISFNFFKKTIAKDYPRTKTTQSN